MPAQQRAFRREIERRAVERAPAPFDHPDDQIGAELAALKQRLGDGGADEACCAGEEGAGACRIRHRDGRRAGLTRE